MLVHIIMCDPNRERHFFAVDPVFSRGNYLGLWGTVWVSCGIIAGVDLGLWLGLVSC